MKKAENIKKKKIVNENKLIIINTIYFIKILVF